MTPEAFARRAERWSDKLTRTTQRFVGGIYGSVGEEVVDRSPRLSGFFRGNWRPSKNAPAQVTISQLDFTGAATKARIKTVGRRYKSGDVLFITNRVPYAEDLAGGSSPQAAAGWVPEAVEDGTFLVVANFDYSGFCL